ncbi:hypothetical protein [Mycolicibacterium thermoresistibile]
MDIVLAAKVALIAFLVVGAATLVITYLWRRRRIEPWTNPYTAPITRIVFGIAPPVQKPESSYVAEQDRDPPPVPRT